MRLPWIQVDQDALVRARTMARLLEIPEPYAVGIAVSLFSWALEMAPDDDLSGEIVDDNPESVVAAAVGWTGDPKKLYAALARVGFIERSLRADSGFDRVKGLWRYASAVANAVTRSDKAKAAARVRWEKAKTEKAAAQAKDALMLGASKHAPAMLESCSNPEKPMLGASKHAPAMLGDAKTQTQTQTQKETLSASPERESLKLLPSGKPDRKSSRQESFYGWAEGKRREVLGEGVLPGASWSISRTNKRLKPLLEVKPELLAEAYVLFLHNEYAQEQHPPCPLGLFVSEWSRYVSEAARGAA